MQAVFFFCYSKNPTRKTTQKWRVIFRTYIYIHIYIHPCEIEVASKGIVERGHPYQNFVVLCCCLMFFRPEIRGKMSNRFDEDMYYMCWTFQLPTIVILRHTSLFVFFCIVFSVGGEGH